MCRICHRLQNTHNRWGAVSFLCAPFLLLSLPRSPSDFSHSFSGAKENRIAILVANHQRQTPCKQKARVSRSSSMVLKLGYCREGSPGKKYVVKFAYGGFSLSEQSWISSHEWLDKTDCLTDVQSCNGFLIYFEMPKSVMMADGRACTMEIWFQTNERWGKHHTVCSSYICAGRPYDLWILR